MTKVLLSHHAGSVELPQGETMVGRGLSCSIRFNDPGISREHLRIVVDGASVAAEEMKSTNGTRVNGQPLDGLTEIQDGDELQIGFRWLSVRILSEEAAAQEETTESGISMLATRAPSPDHDMICVLKPPPPSSVPMLPALDKVTCPRCRTLIDAGLSACPKCNHELRDGRPRSVTRRLEMQGLDRRSAPRYPVDIPLLYSSDTLTFDAVARDLSVGGIFVASELLDPVGTRCSVTILPDGSPPVSFVGVVCRVIEGEGGVGGKPPGLGIKFDKLNGETEHWLSAYIEQGTPA